MLQHLRSRVALAEISNAEKREELVNSLLRIFETRIFPLQEMSFLQYVVLLLSQPAGEEDSCFGTLFQEKIISWLICKSFDSTEHMSVRLHALNYAASFAACGKAVKQDTFL